MAVPERDSLADLEKHMQLLQENVDKLTDALETWRQWKAEYEELQHDISSLPKKARRDDLAEIRETFEGELVTAKELADIFGKTSARNTDQVLSVLTNRVDYVDKNIATLEKQLQTAENKLAAAAVVSNPDATDEDGLPITEIMEELDDDDNVISYSLRRPGDKESELLAALKEAGLSDAISSEKNGAQSSGEPTATAKATSTPAAPTAEPNVTKKKSVAFTEDTKPEVEPPTSRAAQRLEGIMRTAREQEQMITEPILPADESPEEAAMRQEMLQYAMADEIRPVVAELTVEDFPTDDDDEEQDYDYDDDYEEGDTDGDTDEDEYGRAVGGYVSDEYRQKMLELAGKLSGYKFGQDENSDEEVEGIGRITVRAPDASTTAPTPAPEPAAKKGVRFAPSLDIAEEAAPAASSAPQSKPVQQTESIADPLSDVMERSSAPAKPTTTPAGSTKKPSRFKKDRVGTAPAGSQSGAPMPLPEKPAVIEPRYAPSGPEGQTIADALVERDVSSEAREPDELDANLLQQEVAIEHRKMHNRMIQRQGGFMKDDEEPVQLLDEDEDGAPRKVSRFKAARLAKN